MSEVNPKTRLVKLSDTALRVDPSEDVRGRKVFDKGHQEIGKVADLLVDESERKVRFLQVESGGVLGIGATEVMIPVDAVTDAAGDEVRIDQSRERLSGAPRYDPKLANDEYWNRVYGYWGYTPYWTQGYMYPPWPGTIRRP